MRPTNFVTYDSSSGGSSSQLPNLAPGSPPPAPVAAEPSATEPQLLSQLRQAPPRRFHLDRLDIPPDDLPQREPWGNGTVDDVEAGADSNDADGGLEPADSSMLDDDGTVSTGYSTLPSEHGAAEEVTYQEPQDTEPLRRFVTRTSSFTKEDFEQLLKTPGMFTVKDAATQMRGISSVARLRSGRPARSRQLLQQPTQAVRRRRRRNRQKSVFRLPVTRPDNHLYIWWSTLVLCLDLTYSAFVVPISIGMMTSFFEANWTSILDYGAGVVFFGDLVINFHVGFIATYNMHKVLVLNGKLVARYYITKGSFLSDLSSSVAWLGQVVLIIVYQVNSSAFNPNTVLYVMEGIRLLRFLRVVRLIRQLLSSCIYASISLESKIFKFMRGQNFMYLVYIIYVILVMVNFLGCLWNFIAGICNYDNTWVNYYPPFVREYGDPDLGMLTADEAKDSVSDIWLYFAGCYWALTTIATIGYGDIVPVSLLETIIVLAVQILGVMFFGLLLSTISEVMQQVNRKARQVQQFRSKMEHVERWMDQMSLPRRLRRQIKTFYAEVWLRQSGNSEDTQLFQELPHVLRNEVAWKVNEHIFRCVPLLRDVDDKTLYLIASKMTPYRFGPGTDLCTEGDPADRLWVLLEGEVMALYHFNEAEHVEGPAVIGELVLLQEVEGDFSVCPCTYRTVSSCTAWMIEWKDLKMLLAYRPHLQESMAEQVTQTLADRINQYPHLWEHNLQQRMPEEDPALNRWSTFPLDANTATEAEAYEGSSAAAAAQHPAQLARFRSAPQPEPAELSFAAWPAPGGATEGPAPAAGTDAAAAPQQELRDRPALRAVASLQEGPQPSTHDGARPLGTHPSDGVPAAEHAAPAASERTWGSSSADVRAAARAAAVAAAARAAWAAQRVVGAGAGTDGLLPEEQLEQQTWHPNSRLAQAVRSALAPFIHTAQDHRQEQQGQQNGQQLGPGNAWQGQDGPGNESIQTNGLGLEREPGQEGSPLGPPQQHTWHGKSGVVSSVARPPSSPLPPRPGSQQGQQQQQNGVRHEQQSPQEQAEGDGPLAAPSEQQTWQSERSAGRVLRHSLGSLPPAPLAQQAQQGTAEPQVGRPPLERQATPHANTWHANTAGARAARAFLAARGPSDLGEQPTWGTSSSAGRGARHALGLIPGVNDRPRPFRHSSSLGLLMERPPLSREASRGHISHAASTPVSQAQLHEQASPVAQQPEQDRGQPAEQAQHTLSGPLPHASTWHPNSAAAKQARAALAGQASGFLVMQQAAPGGLDDQPTWGSASSAGRAGQHALGLVPGVNDRMRPRRQHSSDMSHAMAASDSDGATPWGGAEGGSPLTGRSLRGGPPLRQNPVPGGVALLDYMAAAAAAYAAEQEQQQHLGQPHQPHPNGHPSMPLALPRPSRPTLVRGVSGMGSGGRSLPTVMEGLPLSSPAASSDFGTAATPQDARAAAAAAAAEGAGGAAVLAQDMPAQDAGQAAHAVPFEFGNGHGQPGGLHNEPTLSYHDSSASDFLAHVDDALVEQSRQERQ